MFDLLNFCCVFPYMSTSLKENQLSQTSSDDFPFSSLKFQNDSDTFSNCIYQIRSIWILFIWIIISGSQSVDGINATKSLPSNAESTAKSSGKIGNENYVVYQFGCMEKHELESFLDIEMFEK